MYVITIDPGSELNQLRKEDAGIVGSSGWHDEQQMLTQLVGGFKHVFMFQNIWDKTTNH